MSASIANNSSSVCKVKYEFHAKESLSNLSYDRFVNLLLYGIIFPSRHYLSLFKNATHLDTHNKEYLFPRGS